MNAFRRRLTVRALMIAVAGVAVALGIEAARRRRAYCFGCAEYYSARARFHRRLAEEERPASAQLAVENQTVADVCERAAVAYRQGASRPWESLPPEPVLPLSRARLSELGDDERGVAFAFEMQAPRGKTPGRATT